MRVTTQEARAWLTERTGYVPGGDFRSLVAVDSHGRVRGLVGFDRWTPNAVHMHVALDAPAAGRALLRAAFAEAFSEGRALARGEVRAGNFRSIALAAHLGFREAHRIRDGWAKGEDMVLFEMRREECRWLKETPHG